MSVACSDLCISQLRSEISDAEVLISLVTEGFMNQTDSLEELEQLLLALVNDISTKKVFIVVTWKGFAQSCMCKVTFVLYM